MSVASFCVISDWRDSVSRPRYQWWGYAKSMIRRYPNKVTPEEYRAVQAAIQETRLLRNGGIRMDIAECVLMKGSHSIEGAARKNYVSESTARIYHTEFIRLVGKNFKCESLLPQ